MTEATITLPLPPRELSKNGRAPWPVRHRLYQAWRQTAAALWREATGYTEPRWDGPVVVVVEWRFRGPEPDVSNVTARLDPIIDAAQDAGLIRNDRQVEAFLVNRVRSREPQVVVTVRRVLRSEEAA